MTKMAAIVFQLAILLAMTIWYAIPYTSTNEIMVRTVPVDPRDFFRGDYVILSYDFNRADEKNSDFSCSKISYDDGCFYRNDSLQNRSVYAILVPETDSRYISDDKSPKMYKLHKLTLKKPTKQTLPSDAVWIKGIIFNDWLSLSNCEFGIEQFFVQEGTGQTIERVMRVRLNDPTPQKHYVAVTLGIGPAGRAGVKNVEVKKCL